MAKRKKRTTKKKNNSKILSYIAWTLALIALALSSLLIGYYLGYSNAEEKIVRSATEHTVSAKLPLKHKEEKKSVDKRLKEVLKKESKSYSSASHEIESEALVNPVRPLPTTKPVVSPACVSKKAKLAIIIDDVSTKSQVRAIKSLGLPLTMSFLPPSRSRPNSAKLASQQSFYMVHLPMEAMHFNKEEPFTMHVYDSQETILQRVHDIKALFPKVAYINNHTGSKFTSNEQAMQRLIYAFNQNGIKFIDSRTTAKTKAPQILKSLGQKYVSRDIFLDHHNDKAYIKTQIKKAIALAKRCGHVIAIGHPHKNTLEALYESKALLKSVDLVLVKEIY